MAAPALLRHALTRLADGDPDAALLARFAARRDGDAFAELVRRHGPVVYRVCRRLLGDGPADDAFQATFLVLATRPHAVRKAGSVGSWLVGVAGRVARQMRTARTRRALHERAAGLAGQAADRLPDAFALTDQFRVLDEELARLPARLRDPIVLCLLQGRTQEEAAADLGGSVRTVRRRLDAAKHLLRVRLERRGVVPAVAAGLAAGVGSVTATVPPGLAGRTTATVFDFLAGGAATTTPAAVLAHGVATTMLARKVTMLLATAAAGLTALGVGLAGDGPTLPTPTLPALPAPAPPALPPPATATPPATGPTLPPVGLGVPNRPEEAATPADTLRIPPLGLPPAPNPAAVPPPLAPDAPVRTANFLVSAPTLEVAGRVAGEAERHRARLAKDWLGGELPPWPNPCQIRVNVAFEHGGGASTFTFSPAKGGGVLDTLKMTATGTVPDILSVHVPHEVMHCVLATHFGKPLPRWADEGIAVAAEPESSQYAHNVRCREILNAGRGIALKQLLEMKEYPRDLMTLYAQGYSVCQFLLTQRSLRGAPLVQSLDLAMRMAESPEGRRKALLEFVGDGMRNGWENAAKAVYGYDSLDAMQEAWITWLRTPPPAPTTGVPVPPTPTAPPALSRDNFRVELAGGLKPAVARAVRNEFEYQRVALARQWLGRELPAWDSTALVLCNQSSDELVRFDVSFVANGIQQGLGARGSFSLQKLLATEVPTTTLHILWQDATHARLPRWVTDGAVYAAGPADVQDELYTLCCRNLVGGDAHTLRVLFAGNNSGGGYDTQGYAIAKFLLSLPTHDRGEGPPVRFTRFVKAGTADGWEKAAKDVYGFADVIEMERKWIEWVKQNPPRAVPAVPTRSAEPTRIPPVRLGAAGPAAAGGAGNDVRFWPSRTVLFPVSVAAKKLPNLQQLRLCVSQDQGATYRVVAAVTPDKERVAYQAPEDGLYWFRLDPVYASGGPTPVDEARAPDLAIHVDTTPPAVQVALAGSDGIEWAAADANLAPDGVTVETRWRGEGKWVKISPRPFAAKDRYSWKGLKGRDPLEVRVVARDRAGNETASSVLTLPLPSEPDRVGRIIIEGNTVTDQQVILARLGLFPGHILRYPRLKEAEEDLARLGIFDPAVPPRVEVIPEDADGVYKNIRVRVKESPRESGGLPANLPQVTPPPLKP